MTPNTPRKKAVRSRKIRVGILRADTHGAYYAALMDSFDSCLLRNPPLRGKPAHYSWQQGVVHFVYHRNCYDPCMMSVPQIAGFSVERLWDPHPEAAECLAEVLHGKPRVCKTIEEASDDVDLLFIAECNGDGSEHLHMARPSIVKGVPTFIDKPFTYGLADALKLVRLAEKHRTPILSLSILREAVEGVQFRRRLEELGPLVHGEILGFGGGFASIIHSFSLAQNVFGSGVRSVECMGRADCERVLLRYDDGKRPHHGVLVHSLPAAPEQGWTWHTGLRAVAAGPERCILSHVMSDYEFPAGAIEILRKIKRMVQTRKPPVPYAEMLELIAVAEAARKAQKERRSVALDEVWKR